MTTRVFSKRYERILHVAICPFWKWTAHHLPKRDELLLYTVFALPNASSTMPASRHCSVVFPDDWLTSASTFIVSFAVSVFPAPDSPEMSTDCADPVRIIAMYADSPTRKTCGGMLSSSRSFMFAKFSAEHDATFLYGLTATTIGPIAV